MFGDTPNIAADPVTPGVYYAVWTAYRTANTAASAAIYLSKSTNDGATWSAPVIPFNNPNANIFQAFGWEVPTIAHFPNVLGPDNKKLAKRHGVGVQINTTVTKLNANEIEQIHDLAESLGVLVDQGAGIGPGDRGLRGPQVAQPAEAEKDRGPFLRRRRHLERRDGMHALVIRVRGDHDIFPGKFILHCPDYCCNDIPCFIHPVKGKPDLHIISACAGSAVCGK